MSGVLAALGGGAISSILGPIIDTITDNLDPIKKEQVKAQIALQLEQADDALMKAQTDIDNTEAGSTNMFVAGWRPAIGWVCASAYATNFVLGPFFTWLAPMVGYHGAPFPKLDLDALTPLTLGMLGLAGYRTFEKVKGLPDSRVPPPREAR